MRVVSTALPREGLPMREEPFSRGGCGKEAMLTTFLTDFSPPCSDAFEADMLLSVGTSGVEDVCCGVLALGIGMVGLEGLRSFEGVCGAEGLRREWIEEIDAVKSIEEAVVMTLFNNVARVDLNIQDRDAPITGSGARYEGQGQIVAVLLRLGPRARLASSQW